MQQQLEIPNMLLSRLTSTAILAAQQSGELLKKSFGSSCETASKAGKHNLVTEYDHKVEKMIMEFIKKHFPDHIFWGEESGTIGENPQAILWIIDPIDGTVNFAHNIPVFSISICATFQGQPLSGVVYDPMRGEMFVAEKGNGAYLNGNKLTVTETSILADSVLATGFPYNIAENPLNCMSHLTNLLKLGIPIRRLGSAALDLAYVAAGRYDGFFEISLEPWDYAAGKLLVEEAGGKLTNYFGENLSDFVEKSTIVATNTQIHDQLLSNLKIESTPEGS